MSITSLDLESDKDYISRLEKKIKEKNKEIKKLKALLHQDKTGGPKYGELPDGVNKETFDNFIKHRKQIKSAMTSMAINRLKNKCQQFIEKGFDPNKALERSVLNGWKDIYEPKDDYHQGQQQSNKKFPDDYSQLIKKINRQNYLLSDLSNKIRKIESDLNYAKGERHERLALERYRIAKQIEDEKANLSEMLQHKEQQERQMS